MASDLLQAGGPDGPIQCTLCGAGPLAGALPHLCPVEAARAVMGGAPAALAAALSAAAYAAGGPRCVEAVAVALRAMAGRLEGGGGRAPGALRVYVAGGAAERAECGVWIRRLREAGVCVTHDWTDDGVWRVAERSPAESAAADLDGVRRCDVLWLLCPVAKSEGSATELGAALAWGKRVVVSGPWDALGRIFPGLAGECYAHHEEAFRGVARAAADLMGRVLLAGGRVSP